LVDLAGAFEPGPRRDEVVDTIRRACEDVGFLVIAGHGVPHGLVQRVDAASRRLFALPLDEKMAWARASDNLRGYVPMGGSALALAHDEVTPPDLSELYTVSRFDDPTAAVRAGSRQGQDEGREAFFAPNVWPDPERVPDFREALTACYAVLEDLAARLMRLMALALDLDEHWFDDKIAEHITGLAVLHYPALDRPPLPGQYRRGPHSDWGSLTILYHDGRPGLQIRSPDGHWEDVPSVVGSFVVNLGDLMAAWTNDRWVSTQHRVVVPESVTGDRISVAFFHQPAYDALIECIPTCTSPDDPPRHEPVASGEWIRLMIDKTTTY
jgi:isopenicillin N synthase-like dioxygenase